MLLGMVSAWSGLNSFVSQTNDACSVVMNIDNRVITRRKFKMKRSQQAAADEMAAESKTGETPGDACWSRRSGSRGT